MALSPIEDRYLSALTAAQFPDMPVAETQQPVADATQFDGMQLAAAPTQVVSDAGGGRGSYAGFDPRMDAANKGQRDEMRAYDPTTRERIASFLQAGFEGLGMDRYKARQNAQTLIGGPSSNLPLDIGIADVVPFLGTALQTEEAVRMGGEAVESAKAGELGTAALQAGGAALGLVPGAAGTIKTAMAVGRAGERLAEKTVPQIMEKGGTMAELLQALSQGSRSQLTAYHGTPHTVDKFDSKKIGTGEGNQTYGYGLYFAESPDVAKSYMAVSPSVLPPPIRTFKGTELEPGSPEYHAASLLDGMSLAQARKTVAGWLENPDPRMTREAEGWSKTLETLNAATSKADFKQKANKGNLYTVDIPDDMVGKMLDWDKPLSDQTPDVQAKLQAVVDGKMGAGTWDNWLKSDPDFKNLQNDLFENMAPAEISALLREAGIPGIRYLDSGSRQTPNITNKRLASLFEKHNGDANAAVDEMMRSVYNTPKKKEEMRTEFMRQLEAVPTRNIVVFPGGENQVKILKQEGKK